MVKEKICRVCGKVIHSSRSVYCCNNCYSIGRLGASRRESIIKYKTHRDNPEFLLKCSNRMKVWYQKNKLRHKQTVLRYYHNNKQRWNCKDRISNFKRPLMKFISSDCVVCGKPRKMIFRAKGFEIATPLDLNLTKENTAELRKFSKKYLKPACSLRCVGQLRRKR